MTKARPFAHLLNRKVSAKVDEDMSEEEKEKDEKAEEDKKPPANDKEDRKKGKKADKYKDNEDEGDDTKASEDSEDDEEDEGEEDDVEENDKKKKSEKEEDKERAELAGTDATAKARGRERERCKAIFSSPHASGRVDTAAHLAFNTKMTANEAIKTLATLPAAAAPAEKKSRLSSAMDSATNPRHVALEDPSPASGGNKASTATQRILLAGKRRRGEA